MAEEVISEKQRAEDILLGSLGFGEDAKIVSIEISLSGYKGIGAWADGEKFEFSCEEELDDLQRWALGIVGALPSL